jgi:hypothetical protein
MRHFIFLFLFLHISHLASLVPVRFAALLLFSHSHSVHRGSAQCSGVDGIVSISSLQLVFLGCLMVWNHHHSSYLILATLATYLFIYLLVLKSLCACLSADELRWVSR